MTAQNIIDAIQETARHHVDPAVVDALRGIVARAQRYEAMEEQATVKTANFTATRARALAVEINTKCSECFIDAKAVRQFGRWVIKIGGGREACYGRTIESEEDAEALIRIFKN